MSEVVEAALSAHSWPPSWPRAYSRGEERILPAGEYRMSPDDFRVEENLGFTPEGAGEHLWLWIEKRGVSTPEMVRRLADYFEVSHRDVGYSGMKDRHAVTRQWFSVALPGRQVPQDVAVALGTREGDMGIDVLEQMRHRRKLKRGVHRGNRFVLRLHGDVVSDPGMESRWQSMCREGVPNYVGPQRFGPEGRNLARARTVLTKGWRKRDDRQGMLLSAARSYLFNQQLAARIRDGNWSTPLAGEVAILDGSSSQFRIDSVDDALRLRARELDIHPSGVLWGVGASMACSQAARYEAVVEDEPSLARGLEKAGVRLGHRALRVRLTAPTLTRDAGALCLSFELPRGSFATSVLRELMTHPTL
ncbi:tRNA pseudouridine(13) synthase TruD [Aidingimonas halophila]|uniref:tRNA pseudouridine synthase D n=1 Tax=Aidingimonas halophila TaxID=574349 RepID=A0A1H2S2P7_9GAMM|nr:tRNA pseudouridine synthase D [Aidingimonas halophila]SDW25826.1 tRNA pseudouridine13 synthase [Aidingimonas halophila]